MEKGRRSKETEKSSKRPHKGMYKDRPLRDGPFHVRCLPPPLWSVVSALYPPTPPPPLPHPVRVAVQKAVEEKSATLVSSWAPGPVKAGLVYRFSVSSRRKPYVDLLVASDKAKKETEVQVAGFSGERERERELERGGGVLGVGGGVCSLDVHCHEISQEVSVSVEFFLEYVQRRATYHRARKRPPHVRVSPVPFCTLCYFPCPMNHASCALCRPTF